MAELVGLAASVITLTAVVKAGGEGLTKLSSCRHAPPRIASLRAKVRSLAQLLMHVKSFKDTAAEPYAHDLLAEKIREAASQVAKLNELLSLPAFGITWFNDKARAALTVFRYGSKLADIDKDLNESIQHIGLRLSLVNT